VVAFAVDARGNPEHKKAPELTADRGTLSAPQPRSDGVWSWTFTAPWEVGQAPVLLHAAQSATRITLRPGPPFHLELVPPEPLPAGSDQPVEILVRVLDDSGSPVRGAELQASLLGGRVVGVREVGDGSYAIRVIPPRDPGRGSTALHVELGSLVPGAPRRVTLHAARGARPGQIAAEAWVDDDLGLPVPGATVAFVAPDGSHQEVVSDRYGVARLEVPRPDARRFRISGELPGLQASLDFLDIGGTLHAVPSIAGRGVVETHESPPGASLDTEVPLQPATPVDVRVRAEPRTTQGQPVRILVTLRGEGKLVWQASAGTLELVHPLQGGSAELRFTPPADARPGARYFISVTEEKSRVTAFAEVSVP
jgi:hypothetical protein